MACAAGDLRLPVGGPEALRYGILRRNALLFPKSLKPAFGATVRWGGRVHPKKFSCEKFGQKLKALNTRWRPMAAQRGSARMRSSATQTDTLHTYKAIRASKCLFVCYGRDRTITTRSASNYSGFIGQLNFDLGSSGPERYSAYRLAGVH